MFAIIIGLMDFSGVLSDEDRSDEAQSEIKESALELIRILLVDNFKKLADITKSP